MMTRIPKGLAPDFTPGYPSKGCRLGPAWQAAWTELAAHRGWTNGKKLARELLANPDINLDVSLSSLANLLANGARYGLLECKIEKADSGRGLRNTAFYRLHPKRELITDAAHPAPFASWERLS